MGEAQRGSAFPPIPEGVGSPANSEGVGFPTNSKQESDAPRPLLKSLSRQAQIQVPLENNRRAGSSPAPRTSHSRADGEMVDARIPDSAGFKFKMFLAT